MTLANTLGLTDAEVAQRVAEGKSNDIPGRAARSIADIVRANVFTRINAILGVLLMIVVATGSLINGLFGLLIIANSVIGMVQEIRAKQTLDQLAVVGQAKPLVRRQSGTRTLLPKEVVLDDIIELGPGDRQCPAARPGCQHHMIAFDGRARSKPQQAPGSVDRGHRLAGDQLDFLLFVKRLGSQPQFVETAVAGEVALGQGRALVGQSRLVADQHHAAAKPLLPQ